MRTSRRGLALLVVMGVLGVLAILGIAFVTMAQLERRASMQRVNATRALLLARSGIEDVLARLSAGQDASALPSAYGGENWDASADGLLSGWEAQQEVYRATGTGTAADVGTCPVQHALRPSFFVTAGANPATQAVDGRQRGYSGVLTASAGGANAYSLKVEDESAKINVNGGFLDGQDRDGDGIPDFRDSFVADTRPVPPTVPRASRGWNDQLARILGLLVQQPELALPPQPTAGTDILLGRPLGGYRSIAQVQAVLGTAKDLSPWLTVSSWADPKVVHPNAWLDFAKPALNGLTDQNGVKKRRMPLRLEEAGRPPVNLNAAPRPVLQALVQGVEGVCWHQPAEPVTYQIPSAAASSMASGIADAMCCFRTGREPFAGWLASGRPSPAPFATWGQFSGFCDALVPTVINSMNTGSTTYTALGDSTKHGGGNLAAADLLKANFDPNTDLNKQLPDQLLYRWIDKSDLLCWSTEGSLYPTGSFRVSVLGRILDRQGRLLAACTLQAGVEAFSLVRHTTQGDFVAGRSLSDLPRYLSLSTDPLDATTGQSASNAWWGGTPPGKGLAVTTYPSAPMALPGNASELDGYIGLASYELDAASHHGGQPVFLHHFDDSWDAEPSSINPSRQPGTYDNLLQTVLGTGIWPDTTLAAPLNEPNTLLPDGMHAQLGHSPGFLALGNVPVTTLPPPISNHGVISYWVKATQNYGESHDIYCVREPALNITQALIVGRDLEYRGIMAENRVDPPGAPGDYRYERQMHVLHTLLRPGLRWELVSAFFDTNESQAPADGKDVHVIVQGMHWGGTPDPEGGYVDPFEIGSGVGGSLNEDISTSPGRLVMGTYRNGAYSDEILDEVAIYDFGNDAAVARAGSDPWAVDRFKIGRYYRGDDASFLSAWISPRAGRPVRLLQAWWTAYLPQETRQEFAAGYTPTQGVPRVLDARLANAKLKMALEDAGGTLSLAQGGSVNRPEGAFRYRALLQSGLAGSPNDPVLETPFLDDVTFSWQAPSGPRVTSWGAP